MPVVKFGAGAFPRETNESVLECLLRHRQYVPYACKAGVCQACLVKAVGVDATEESRKWIKPSLRALGYALACQWVPEGDVEVRLPAVEEFSVPARIQSLDPLNARVLRLRLEVLDRAAMFHCRPGQYLSLINPEGVARSYSIANDHEAEGFIELHVGATARGAFTGWLFERARPGDTLHMRGPAGDCFYQLEEEGGYPILLAGTGTGLAPLYGILREALRQAHPAPLTLVHGGRDAASLYLVRELLALQDEHAGFTYVPVSVEGGGAAVPGLVRGRVEDVALARLDPATVARARIFLCGAPAFVHGLRKRVFLQGARAQHIHCDPFIERTFV